MATVNCNWIHLCDHAAFDERQKAILVGIFHHITAKAVPAVHPACSIVYELQGPAADLEVTVRLVAPSGSEVLSAVRQIKIKGAGDGRALSILNLFGLPVPEFGRYRVTVEIAGEKLKEATLDVVPLP